MDSVFRHEHPVWEHLANHSVLLRISSRIFAREYDYEQIAARHIVNRKYELCALPLFESGYCVGDIVEVDNDNIVIGMAQKSKRFGFRVYVPNGDDDATTTELKKLVKSIEKFHGIIEPNSRTFFGIDAESEATATKISDLLYQMEKTKFLEYDTARL